MKRLLCIDALPRKDHRGNSKCYGEFSKTELCVDCYNENGELRRLYLNREVENKGNQGGWDENKRVT